MYIYIYIYIYRPRTNHVAVASQNKSDLFGSTCNIVYFFVWSVVLEGP